MNSHVASLNDRLGQAFGFSPILDERGLPYGKFAWRWTPDLQYFYREDFTKTFARKSFADRMGKVWVLAKWEPVDMPESEFRQATQDQFPYPRNGRFMPLNVALEPGELPTDWYTSLVIDCITTQMGKTYSQFEEEAVALGNAPMEETRKTFEDRVDDEIPDHDPGVKDHISYSTTKGQR